MGAFKNRATEEYRQTEDHAIKAELIAAGIPYIELPFYSNSEVKTRHFGILNGFIFARGWRYWICKGYMPLAHAQEIYARYQDLAVRAEGHAGNPEPTNYSSCPILDEKRQQLLKELQHQGVCTKEMVARLDQIQGDPSWPRYILTYHIDTAEGLKALAQYIKENTIYAHNGEEGSYAASVFNP